MLNSLNEPDDRDYIRIDSCSAAEFTNGHTLSKEEKLVEKILRKTESLLKIKENDGTAKMYRKFFEILLHKTRFKGNSLLEICVKCDDPKLMEHLWAILHKFQLYELLELRNSNQETCAHLSSALNKPKILGQVIKHGIDVNAVDAVGNTALHIATQMNHNECVEAILNADFNFNGKAKRNIINLSITNDNGYTPLHLACINNNLNVVKLLDTKAMQMKQTIFDDIDGKHGNTALHIAIESRAVAVVEFILQNERIKPTTMNKSGHTAMYLAHVIKSIEMLNLIQQNDDDDDEDASSSDSFDSPDESESEQA